MLDKKRLVEKTRWLRPYIQWATRFSLAAPGWLPGFVRFAPLRLAQWVLRGYHKALR
jgi:hypothetical protein